MHSRNQTKVIDGMIPILKLETGSSCLTLSLNQIHARRSKQVSLLVHTSVEVLQQPRLEDGDKGHLPARHQPK